MQRKYWVQFKVARKDHPIEYREVEISRGEPIRGVEDLQEICKVLANGISNAGLIPKGEQFAVGVIAWTAFESWLVKA